MNCGSYHCGIAVNWYRFAKRRDRLESWLGSEIGRGHQ